MTILVKWKIYLIVCMILNMLVDMPTFVRIVGRSVMLEKSILNVNVGYYLHTLFVGMDVEGHGN